MNITKQQWTIIGVVVAIIAVWYFFLRKKKTESSWIPGRPNWHYPTRGVPVSPINPPISDPTNMYNIKKVVTCFDNTFAKYQTAIQSEITPASVSFRNNFVNCVTNPTKK